MNRLSLGLAAALSIATIAQASDLNLSVQSAGSNTITVGPGATVNYTIVGELSDNASHGLAMFSATLEWTGGSLAQASTPASAPMNNFSAPLGFNNPAGFGGTPVAGKLIQVGGAQNTIKNTFAPIPTGTVIPDLAQHGSAQVLVTGSFTTPYTVGTYTLKAYNGKANVIRAGETGSPFWHCDKAGQVTSIDLTVHVEAITVNQSTVSITAGQSQVMHLDAGPANAGRPYLLLGSYSGSTPGYRVGGLTLPLNVDGYFVFTRSYAHGAPYLQNSLGLLDAQGHGTVTFTPARRFIGYPLIHAFCVLNPVNFVSEAEPVTVIP